MALVRMLMLIALAVFIICVSAVDRGNFKTCSQSGFCKRQRDYKAETSPYSVLLNTAVVEDSKITVEILNTKTNVRLRMQIFSLEGNAARLKIDEAEATKERYEVPVGDCLVGEPQLGTFTVESKDDKSYTLAFGENKLVLQAQPFRIDFLIGTEPVLSVNAKGLLKFEHYRQRDVAEEAGQEAADDPAHEENQEEKEAQPEADEPDMWEETFKTHADSKPFGPSSIGLDVSYNGFEHVYGIPEHADTFALKSTKDTDPYRLYNLDVFEYELWNPMALYGSVPVMYAHNEQYTVGMFWQNAAEGWIDVRSSMADKGTFSKLVDMVKGDSDIPQVDTHWMFESGIVDIFFLLGPTPNDVFSQYAALTGTTPLPPLFAIAYHQCRWNYNDEDDVANVDAGFDAYDIPMDVLWLDIEHTDGKRYFTWDKTKFPTPENMINKVAAKGRKMVTIIDPHIKRDDNYHVHKETSSAGLYIKNKDGNDYDGFCWPGSSGWIDFLDPKGREFWAEKFQLDQYSGSTLDLYTWNDMNEPSVFNGPEITMHKDAKHYGGWEHRDVHNMYGTYVHRATYEGHLVRANSQKRPFVLSRAFFAGSQRYGAVWTGDNTGDWGHLKMSIPMLLSLNIVGITFSGADVGGFFKNPDAELLTRWYQAGAYQPFFRAHAHHDTRRREPWLLDDEYTKVIRSAICARYRLLPYWYTLFYQTEQHGGPIMKPLWVDFPTDKLTFGMEDQYMIGSALLVHPVTDAGSSGVNVYLPGSDDVWYDIDTYQKHNGGQNIHVSVTLEKIPVYQRGGTIIPRKERIRRSSALTYSDPFTLVVAVDKKGYAEGDLYIDEYDSFQYQQGEFALRHFTFDNNQLTNSDLNSNSQFHTKAWLERVVLVGISSRPSAVELTGTGLQPSSLQSIYDSKTQVLTIRKPGVNMNADWVLTLR